MKFTPTIQCPASSPASHTCEASSQACVKPALCQPKKRGRGNRGPSPVLSAQRLLLLVDCGGLHLFAFSVRSAGGHRPRLAVSRNGNAARDRILAVLFVNHRQGVIVNLRIRACVGRRITRHRTVFPVELAGPFTVRGFTVATDAVHRNFHAVARRLIHDGSIFYGSGAYLRLGLIQFPCAHVCVVRSQANRRGGEQYCKRKKPCLCSHTFSPMNFSALKALRISRWPIWAGRCREHTTTCIWRDTPWSAAVLCILSFEGPPLFRLPATPTTSQRARLDDKRGPER